MAKFIGFAQFYSLYIHHFELRISALRAITTKLEYTEDVAPVWTDEAEAAFCDIRDAILSDPCLMRFNHQRLVVIRTDFSSVGFGCVVLQPDTDETSEAAMLAYRAGQDFSFMTKNSAATLRPVAFCGRRCRGNETRLHSHLGEGFAGDWGINKNRHMLFGTRFVWVTDCYAIRFILSYDGNNPAILRLQMRLMCWDVDIVHRNDIHLTDADYWSRLGADICFDPQFKGYLDFNRSLRAEFPAPTDLPMRPENMPYYRGPRVTLPPATDDAAADSAYCQSLAATVVSYDADASCHLANVPVRFGVFQSVTAFDSHSSTNNEFPRMAHRVLFFNWAIYSFGGGHFASSIQSRGLPFRVVLACDQYESGRALFHEFTACPNVFSNGKDLLHHIRASGDSSQIHGYLIHSLRFRDSNTTSTFWQLQAAIIAQLRSIRNLQLFIAIVIPDHDGKCVRSFTGTLKRSSWVLSSLNISFPDIGDSVAGECRFIIGVHTSSTSVVEPLMLTMPPAISRKRVSDFLWEPFNKPDHAVSLGRTDDDFCRQDIRYHVCDPTTPSDYPPGVIVAYHLLHQAVDKGSLSGSAVLSPDSLCPAFDACPNTNMFGHFFGIEFHFGDHTHVRGISQFEFARCFGFMDDLTYRLSQPGNRYSLDAATPALTSTWLFDQILTRLILIRDSNCEVFAPRQFAAPSATIQSFVSGAIGSRLTSHQRWVEAYAADKECVELFSLVRNPGKICKDTLKEVHYCYRQPLQSSHLVIENDFLIFWEPIRGSASYTRLQIVPTDLRNIVFTAFHSNPIGGHFNSYRTLHRLRLRYYWPKMWSYVERMCNACPGCALANATHRPSSELVYNFPIDALFRVLFVDGYSAGKHASFEGDECYLITCCGMTGFSAMEPIQHATSTSFSSGLCKIQLRYGFCHTIVLDKDSKFFGAFKEACDLLQLNCHVLSGGNHNPMMVERVNRYLNKGLKIMTNERGSVRIAMEAILLLLYAWNSAPIPGTDLSRSFVALGREFQFPIDFSADKHFELTSTPASVRSYSKDLAQHLAASQEVAKLLVEEQRAMHREFVNSRRPDPRIYSAGDIVFARRAVRSDASRGVVDKLSFPFTGPWRIVRKLAGASYEIEHCKTKRVEKKHSSDLSPYPPEIIPFQPLDGADNQFGQLHKKISDHPYIQAGIDGFTPPQPFQVPLNFIDANGPDSLSFHWPTLAELNAEFFPGEHFEEDDEPTCSPILYTGPPPSTPMPLVGPSPFAPSIPPANALAQCIISSSDKLFFISHNIGTDDCREWRLVRVALDASMSSYSSCLTNGRFIVDFYLGHPDDFRQSAINQRFWLHYLHQDDINTPASATHCHLLRPSDHSESYAHRNKLVPVRKYVNLTHSDTFIYGPFDFATIGRRKSRDRIDQSQWDILKSHSNMFRNSLPSFDVPSYSIHIDECAHTIFYCGPLPSSDLSCRAKGPERDFASTVDP